MSVFDDPNEHDDLSATQVLQLSTATTLLPTRISHCLFPHHTKPYRPHPSPRPPVLQPHVLDSMGARLDELNRGHYEPDRGKGDPAACKAAEANGGFYGPWL